MDETSGISKSLVKWWTFLRGWAYRLIHSTSSNDLFMGSLAKYNWQLGWRYLRVQVWHSISQRKTLSLVGSFHQYSSQGHAVSHIPARSRWSQILTESCVPLELSAGSHGCTFSACFWSRGERLAPSMTLRRAHWNPKYRAESEFFKGNHTTWAYRAKKISQAHLEIKTKNHSCQVFN